jgi:hypothetical protein
MKRNLADAHDRCQQVLLGDFIALAKAPKGEMQPP